MKRAWAFVILLVLVMGLLVPSTMAQGPTPQAPPDAEGEVSPESHVPAPAAANPLVVTYTYTNSTPVAIPDSSCPNYVTSTITVPDSFSIGDLNVGLWIEHTYRGDLEMFLMGPDGTTVELYTDPDSSGDNINVLFDDSATGVPDTSLHNPPPPYYYIWWYPEGSLADFFLEDAQGTWTLQLCDDAGGDTGTLQTWTLFFQTGLILNPAHQSGSACKGNDVVYTYELVNTTGVTTSFSLAYTSAWPVYGPPSTPVLADGESWQFDITVHIPWAASPGDQDTMTVTASGAGDTTQATATTSARLVSGYMDYTDAPRPVRDHSVVYWDGKIYKIGGYDGGYRDYVDIYDIASDSWYTGTNVPAGRAYWDCVAIDAKIYCAGGYSPAGNTLYIYDIASNTWSTGASLPEYRYTYAGVALDGKYYVIGGYGPSPSPYYKDTIWAYDPGTNTWDTTLTPMSTGRRYHSAGVIGGKIYVAGGYVSPGGYLDSAEVYDPGTNTWTPVASMPSTWGRSGDAVKHDRFLLMFGGDDNSSAVASEYGLIYDATLDQWDWLPNMAHSLYATEADGDGNEVWISSGRLYEGGYRYSEYHFKMVQCPETCDPVTGADFSWDPPIPWAGYEVTFSGVATGTPAILYEWDFGDGTAGLGQVVPHVYADPDLYTVVMTATNCDGVGQAVASHDVQVVLPPIIDVDPDSLWASQCPDEVTSQDLVICNLGDAPLEWSICEVSPTVPMAAVPVPAMDPVPAVPVAEQPVITSKEECAAYETYAGREPIGYAEFCMDHTPSPWVSEGSPLAPTDIGYAQDIGYISDNFVTFVLNDFPGQTVLGTTSDAYYGMDFDPAAAILYALNDTTGQLGTISLVDGSFTALVPCAPPVDLWTGLTIDPVSGVFYASDPTDLYIIDPATGNYTLVGPFNTGGSIIDIAINPDGDMYGHDIGTDSIYQIDPGTGAATLLGPTGYAANYAQGMDFDNDDGTLYIFLYIGSGANVYGTVDLQTGAVSPLSVDNPLGEFEGATQTAAYIDIPWLSEDPITGTVPGQGCTTVTVSFDSTGMAAGDYYADLLIESNDPVSPEVTVPVTLTVNPPPDLEVIAPPLDVEVCLDMSATLDMSICNLGVCTLDWEIQELTQTLALAVDVVIPAGAVTADPAAKGSGHVRADRQPLHLALSVPVVPEVSYEVLLVSPDSTLGDISGLLAALAAFPDLTVTVWDNNAGNPSLGDLEPYDVVIIGNDYTWEAAGLDKTVIGDNLADYIDGGGRVIESLYVQSFDEWGFGGRYMTDGYSAFTMASLDNWNPDTMNIVEPGHPVMAGVSAIGDNWGHQNPGLAAGATLLATWQTSGYNAVAVNENVVALNQLIFHAADWTGDVPTLLHNAVVWLIPRVDVPWLSEDPTSGSLGADECVTVTVTFDAAGMALGTYNAFLRILSNDADTPSLTLPVTMTVLPMPVAGFESNTPVCLGEVAVFTNTSSNADWYLWDFGDGTTSTETNPLHDYTAADTYTVTLTAYSYSCGESVAVDLFVVNPLPAASFDYDPVSGTVPLTVAFTNTSMYAISPTWDFGDGSPVEMGDFVTHTYDVVGDYTATLTVESEYGCGAAEASAMVHVAVSSPPVAGFESSSPDCLGETTYFTNTTTGGGPITYLWDLGDGTTSTETNPMHAYAAGTYTVIMTATNPAGSDTVSHDVTVDEAPAGADFVWSPMPPVVNAPVLFTGSVVTGTNVGYDWDFGDGTLGAGITVTHVYTRTGTYTVTMLATNPCGWDGATHVLTVGEPIFYIYLPLVYKPAP